MKKYYLFYFISVLVVWYFFCTGENLVKTWPNYIMSLGLSLWLNLYLTLAFYVLVESFKKK